MGLKKNEQENGLPKPQSSVKANKGMVLLVAGIAIMALGTNLFNGAIGDIASIAGIVLAVVGLVHNLKYRKK